MKTTLTIVAILISISTGAYLLVHSAGQEQTMEITLLRDITDKELAQPDANQILSMYHLQGNRNWNGGVFNFANISDISLNKEVQVTISSENQWLSNELERTTKIKQFEDGITEIIKSSQTDSMGKSHSSVYIPIANALNQLSQSKSTQKILIVFSDLMENTQALSFYSQKDLTRLSDNPTTIQNMLELWQPLPSLAGIAVYLIFQPATTTEDHQYHIVSQFYKNLLESRGARVVIEANLSNGQ